MRAHTRRGQSHQHRDAGAPRHTVRVDLATVWIQRARDRREEAPFLRATPGCPPTYHIAVAIPERAPKVLSGLKLYSSLDFNGRLIAAGGAGANLIQLERVN
jgi:hypothetical protein